MQRCPLRRATNRRHQPGAALGLGKRPLEPVAHAPRLVAVHRCAEFVASEAESLQEHDIEEDVGDHPQSDESQAFGFLLTGIPMGDGVASVNDRVDRSRQLRTNDLTGFGEGFVAELL